MILSDKDPGYRQCSLSVLDNIADPDIRFDEKGICNYYYQYKREEAEIVPKGDAATAALTALLDRIKAEGKGKPYDCVTGVSGGVDSSYLIYKAKEWGLRPLIVHFDNGWNSEIAVKNINSIIEKTGFNLYTLVVNWEEFRDLQLAYLKASVVDLEVPTDHAITGTLQRLAAKFNIRTILSGNNVVTEAIMPPSWIFNKNDYANLLDIQGQYGTQKLKTYPVFGIKEQYYYGRIKKVHTVKPLNLVPFNKDEAKAVIKEAFGWQDYGGKHYESTFTKFYQAYILPHKFHIDKRKAHYSNLIFSGMMTKDQAMEELRKPLYDPIQLAEDKEYVCKKWGLSQEEFERYMQLPRRDHREFAIDKGLSQQNALFRMMSRLYKLMR